MTLKRGEDVVIGDDECIYRALFDIKGRQRRQKIITGQNTHQNEIIYGSLFFKFPWDGFMWRESRNEIFSQDLNV